MFFIVFSLVVMEIRIKRASLYIDKVISRNIKILLKDQNILSWESSPNPYANFIERNLAGSIPSILILFLSAFFISIWFIFFSDFKTGTISQSGYSSESLIVAGVIGMVSLTLISFFGISLSFLRERR